MTATQASFPGRAVDVQVRAARASPARGSASCCRTRPGSPTSSASSSRCTPRPSTTTRRSRSSRPAPSWPAGRASARGCPTAWAARTDDLPAFVVMVSQGAAIAATSRSTTGSGAAAFCRRSIRASSSARSATRCCTCRTRRASTRATRRRMLDDLAQTQSD